MGAMEHDVEWRDAIMNINMTNVLVLQQNLGRKYCELDYAEAFVDKPGGHEWAKGTIDYFSIDGRLRYPSTEWMLQWIKPHGGIVVFDNSDRKVMPRPEEKNNATDLMPKHWLRYDSSHFKQHIEPIKDKRWLKNSMTSIWITRSEKCAQGRFDLNGGMQTKKYNKEYAAVNFDGEQATEPPLN